MTIKAQPASVWDALTNPALVKQYLFGTNVQSDWQVGSPITYTGEWEGKAYEDKGTIVEVIPEKVLVTTYWSSVSGTPDTPENYKTVRYELTPNGQETSLTVTQDNNKSQEEADHSTQNWNTVLQGMKNLLEK